MRLLDLFCGAGGASMGYSRAFPGVEIVGVDIESKPLQFYPFAAIQGDAMNPPVDLDAFDLIHASPPCQAYSATKSVSGSDAPMLIDDVRSMLAGRNYIIENVVGAPMPTQQTLTGEYGTVVCGSMFGLRVRRHRLFETSFPVSHGWCNHKPGTIDTFSSATRQRVKRQYQIDGADAVEKLFRKECGLDWMPQRIARQSFPVQFTEWIGEQYGGA